MFTYEEAQRFIADVLRIENPAEKFQEDRLALLSAIIRAFHYVLPFQDITLQSLSKEERRAPSVDDIKRDTLAAHGGLCNVLNASLMYILKAIGFDVHFIPSAVIKANDHTLIVANNVIKDGDQFLVDGGSGYPTFEAIPLDFDDESPVYRFSFSHVKFVRKGDVIERLHLRRTDKPLYDDGFITAKGVTDTCTWLPYYDFKVTPVDLSHYDAAMNDVYTNVTASPFLLSLRVISFPGGVCTAIKDDVLLREGEDNRLHATKMESIEEIKKWISKLCPQLPSVKVDLALKHWGREFEPTMKK